jgi:hypothetical protein
MSQKKTTTFCLVIDADIARAAGSLESNHPRGSLCRDFLLRVRGICHRMAWTDAIRNEWEKHRSKFATEWLASMTRLNKLRRIDAQEAAETRDEISESCPDKAIIAKVLKDFHLIEAALATDSRVASLDETARGHFSRLSAGAESLQNIVWINPTIEDEKAVEWLEQGAPLQKKRLL